MVTGTTKPYKRGSIQHIELNISDPARSKPFYNNLLSWLGYRMVMDEKGVVGWTNGEAEIFLVKCDERFRSRGFHRKRIGLNHIAFRSGARDEVDKFHREFLVPRGIPALYGGPKEYPHYGPGYYAVYFEDPDRIKLEFVHSR